MFNGDDPSSKSTTPFCPDRGLMNQLQLCLTCLMGVHGHLRQFPERYKDCPSSSSWSFLIPPYHIILINQSYTHNKSTIQVYKSTTLPLLPYPTSNLNIQSKSVTVTSRLSLIDISVQSFTLGFSSKKTQALPWVIQHLAALQHKY